MNRLCRLISTWGAYTHSMLAHQSTEVHVHVDKNKGTIL